DFGLCSEEARHLTCQFGVERLIDRGKNAAGEQARDKVLCADIQLLREIFYADTFRDRNVACDRQRLVRHHHAWRRNVALHRSFFDSTWNVALSRTTRRTSRTATWTRRRSRRRKAGSNSNRTRSCWRLACRMHRTAFARAQRWTSLATS